MSSRFLEVRYEDGLSGTLRAPEEWGNFCGANDTYEDGVPSSKVHWGKVDLHPYTLYMMIKENRDALSSLTNYKG